MVINFKITINVLLFVHRHIILFHVLYSSYTICTNKFRVANSHAILTHLTCYSRTHAIYKFTHALKKNHTHTHAIYICRKSSTILDHCNILFIFSYCRIIILFFASFIEVSLLAKVKIYNKIKDF